MNIQNIFYGLMSCGVVFLFGRWLNENLGVWLQKRRDRIDAAKSEEHTHIMRHLIEHDAEFANLRKHLKIKHKDASEYEPLTDEEIQRGY